MKAMITGAASGIGYEMAIYLSKLGYELLLVDKQKDKLEQLQNQLFTKSKIILVDLANEQKVKELCVLTKNEEVDLLINNAGFGLFGAFYETDIQKELDMLAVNVKAVHLLTKFFLREMMKQDKGMILNVASSAAFYPGPLLSSYYASKSYVYRLSLAIKEELRREKSHVQISVLCPGPVKTLFNQTAGVEFRISSLSSSYVAKYAIDKCLQGKTVIIPGTKMKVVKFFSHFLSDQRLARMSYQIQKKRNDENE